jgi:hypothetical protein
MLFDGTSIADAVSFFVTEVLQRSDRKCVVDGLVERDLCRVLFTNPKMQKALKKWNFAKSSACGGPLAADLGRCVFAQVEQS